MSIRSVALCTQLAHIVHNIMCSTDDIAAHYKHSHSAYTLHGECTLRDACVVRVLLQDTSYVSTSCPTTGITVIRLVMTVRAQ